MPRLIDALAPLLGPDGAVAEVSPSGAMLESLLPPGTPYSLGHGSSGLQVAAFSAGDDLPTVVRSLDSARPAVLVAPWAPADVPVERLERALGRVGLQLLGALPLDYRSLRLALAVGPSGKAPEGYRPLVEVEVEDLRRRVSVVREPAESVAPSADAERRVAEMTQRLREAEGRLRTAERRVRALEGSTAFRVGSALVDAARNPRRGVVRLPRTLAASVRYRGRKPAGATATATRGGAEPVSDLVEQRRFLAHTALSTAPRDRLVIVGALSRDTADALGAAATVTRATPDDAALLVERLDPDLVLIETAAAGIGSAWAHLGDPAAAERERRVLDMLAAARAAGRPVVLLRNTPVHLTASLDALAARCDLVLDGESAAVRAATWDRGADLRGALAVESKRDGVLYAGAWDPRLPAARRRRLEAVLRQAMDAGLVLVGSDDESEFPSDLHAAQQRVAVWSQVKRLARQRAVVVADPFDVGSGVNSASPRTLDLAATGARVVSSTNESLVAALGASLVSSVDEPSHALREALSRGPLDAAEHHDLLRRLLLEHSTAAALVALAGLLGLDEESAETRTAAVVARVASAGDVPELVSAVLSQRWRPRHVQLATTDGVDVAAGQYAELLAAGIQVEVLPEALAGSALATPAAATVLHWQRDSRWDEHHVVDALVEVMAR